MTRYGSEFPEPPWTYAPKEVEEWLTAVAKGAKVSRMDAFRNEQGRLENLEVQLDVDAVRTKIRPSPKFLAWLKELMGRTAFEAHFEVAAIAELVMHALEKARFHGFGKIEIDGQPALYNPQRTKDTRSAVQLLAEASHRQGRCNSVKFTAFDDELGDSKAIVTIRRQTKKGEHNIHARFEGEVAEVDFQAFLGFLREELNATFEWTPPPPA